MKIGLLLGTFDPPHIGHFYLAIQALERCSLDGVWLVPAWNSPWKPNATSFEKRVEMCRALVAWCPKVNVCESDRVFQAQYTHEFLKDLLKYFPENEYTIISGSDIDFDKWVNGDWVKNNFNHFVVTRSELECSSTHVREIIKDGKNPIPFISPNLYKIILDNKLYVS